MKRQIVTGKMDSLGRVILPKDYRARLALAAGERLELELCEDEIHLRKKRGECVFCGAKEGLFPFHGKEICTDCIVQLRQKGQQCT